MNIILILFIKWLHFKIVPIYLFMFLNYYVSGSAIHSDKI